MDNQAIMDEMVAKARQALKELSTKTQEEIDTYCKVAIEAIRDNARELAYEAVEETGMGNPEHKVQKLIGGAGGCWLALKNKKSIGIIGEDKKNHLTFVAHPKGIIAGVIPTTNPNMTVMFNGVYAMKGANVIIVSPHPRAKKSTFHTIQLIEEALAKVGAPKNIFQAIEKPSIEMSQLLMATSDTILATGGEAMVHSAYSSGTPAYGVGPGNHQTIYDDRYENLDEAVDKTIFGCTYDNGIVCACNRSFITPKAISGKIKDLLLAKKAIYIEDAAMRDKVRELLFPNGFGAINGEPVGKDVKWLCDKLGLDMPEGCPIIVVKLDKYGADEPLVREKMVPLAVHIDAETKEDAVDIAIANLNMEGAGHSSGIMTDDPEFVKYAALRLPVSRIGVAQAGQFTANAFLNTGLEATGTLGCGSWAGCSVSWNLGYKDLINVSQIAWTWPEDECPTEDDIWNGDAEFTARDARPF